MDYGGLVYKVDCSVQSSLSSSLMLNPNTRFLPYCSALRTLSCNIGSWIDDWNRVLFALEEYRYQRICDNLFFSWYKFFLYFYCIILQCYRMLWTLTIFILFYFIFLILYWFYFILFLFWTIKRHVTLQSHDRSHDVTS